MLAKKKIIFYTDQERNEFKNILKDEIDKLEQSDKIEFIIFKNVTCFYL